MAGPVDPVAEMIMRLIAEGGARGLPMQPSRGLQGHLNARTRGFPAPQVSNVVPGPGSGAAEIRSPDFLPDVGSQMADEGRLPPTRFQQSEGEFTDQGITPQDVMGPAGARAQGGNGEFYIWAVKDGKPWRVDGPFKNELEAQRNFQMMKKEDPHLVARMGAYIAGPGE